MIHRTQECVTAVSFATPRLCGYEIAAATSHLSVGCSNGVLYRFDEW